MKIEHIAVWTKDLERLRRFYETFFEAQAGRKYVNTSKGFASYFLTFQSGARLEIMSLAGIAGSASHEVPQTGYAHLAFSAGSKAAVQALTHQIADAGFRVVSPPRTTGDGYYESVIADPDGNLVEITV